MTRLSNLQDIERLYADRGALQYGEDVTQLEHAVQCASLAEADGAAPSLIAAALLHDVGHLVQGEQDAAKAGVDDRHEIRGAQALADLFSPSVHGPIALHVAAKRYLCFKEPAYFDALSAASKLSLGLQGGVFDAAEADAFEQRPHWSEAVRLRRYDEEGKREDLCGRSFAYFLPLMRNLLINN